MTTFTDYMQHAKKRRQQQNHDFDLYDFFPLAKLAGYKAKSNDRRYNVNSKGWISKWIYNDLEFKRVRYL